MSKNTPILLVALIALSAAQFPFLSSDVAEGEQFELNLGPEKAEEQARTVEYLTVTNQFARIATDTESASKTPDADKGPPAKDPRSKSKAQGSVEVRVLQACDHGDVNDVVTIGKEDLAGAKSLGLVDDDPEAVKYARSLKKTEA